MKIDARFEKTGDMRFISHLDLMRLFQRALRRADLPVTVTQGFSPHLKISIDKALKLGVESLDESLTVHMSKAVESALFIELLNKNLPKGVKIAKCEKIG
ncbi:MAG: TIGR03936 family radical SAM-associated protein [Candidatus Omnitrophota bacterium]|nr:TIGR03936 family radical SAM-associated protein [Candidatus Omnitrophota bacterium]